MLLPVDDDIAPIPFVFGYGSLIWRPGFSHDGAELALLRGAHRSLCVYSHRYRGTRDKPGLVFGLAHGGSCHGMAFAVRPERWAEVRAYLWERELVSGVYRPALRQVRLGSGQRVEALAFLADPRHVQYAGRLSLEEQLRLVRQGIGAMGANSEYVLNTARHLSELGVEDQSLATLSRALAGASRTA